MRCTAIARSVSGCDREPPVNSAFPRATRGAKEIDRLSRGAVDPASPHHWAASSFRRGEVTQLGSQRLSSARQQERTPRAVGGFVPEVARCRHSQVSEVFASEARPTRGRRLRTRMPFILASRPPAHHRCISEPAEHAADRVSEGTDYRPCRVRARCCGVSQGLLSAGGSASVLRVFG